MKYLIAIILLSSCGAFKPLPLYTHTWEIEVTYRSGLTDTVIQHRVLPNPTLELDFPTHKNPNSCIYFNVTHCENELVCDVDTFRLLDYKATL